MLTVLKSKLSDPVPVKGKTVTRDYSYRVRSLDVAHDVASQIDGVHILDWTVVVTSLPRRAIVSRDADTLEGTLIYAIDIDTLLSISRRSKPLYRRT
jgi:hypothetical protein